MDPDRGTRGLARVPKSSLGFFDSGMLKLFDSEQFLADHVIPRDGETL